MTTGWQAWEKKGTVQTRKLVPGGVMEFSWQKIIIIIINYLICLTYELTALFVTCDWTLPLLMLDSVAYESKWQTSNKWCNPRHWQWWEHSASSTKNKVNSSALMRKGVCWGVATGQEGFVKGPDDWAGPCRVSCPLPWRSRNSISWQGDTDAKAREVK